jgi:antitoxin FitA
MAAMATLYVRNVPDDLYEKLQAWAAENGRSLNAVILEILAEQAELRKSRAEFERRFAELKAKNRPVVGPWEELIREDRDRGHKPEFGYY